MSEKAAIWLRVSSDKQDEQNQAPDTDAYAEARGYQVTRRYTVHAKSAFHGRHQADLDRVLEDARAGLFTVLVIWHSDRIERRPGKALLDVLDELRAAGCRVESVQEPALGKIDMGGQIVTFVSGLMNHEKSAHLSAQVIASHDTIRANGGHIGRSPWGYRTEGPKYARALVTAPEAHRFVPAIFRLAIEGHSLMDIAEWLTAEGARPRRGAAWSPTSVGHILHCTAYAGRILDKAGVVVETCEAVISMQEFTDAQQAMATRLRQRGDARSPARLPALLAGILRCGDCTGPMYRMATQQGTFYRCSADPALAPIRKSRCAHMIRLELADEVARALLMASEKPVMEKVWREGDSTAAELAETLADIADAQARYNSGSLPLAEYVARLTELDKRKAGLESREPVPGHYVLVETGVTYGQRAAELADDDAALRDLVKGKGQFYALRGEAAAEIVTADGQRGKAAGGGGLPVLVFRDAGEVFGAAA